MSRRHAALSNSEAVERGVFDLLQPSWIRLAEFSINAACCSTSLCRFAPEAFSFLPRISGDMNRGNALIAEAAAAAAELTAEPAVFPTVLAAPRTAEAVRLPRRSGAGRREDDCSPRGANGGFGVVVLFLDGAALLDKRIEAAD